MKAFFALYHDYNFEARTPELIEICRNIGILNISLVTMEKPNKELGIKCTTYKKGYLKYLDFIKKCKKVMMEEEPDFVFLHDNTSMPLVRWIKINLPNAKIILDDSELYIEKIKFNNLKQFIGSTMHRRAEYKYICEVDVVIAANQERAEIMRKFYKLNQTPMVLSNIRKLEEEYNSENCAEKFESILSRNGLKVLCGGGLNRPVRELINAINALNGEAILILTGRGDSSKIEYINAVEQKNGNIKYLGLLRRDEWQYLLERCDVGVISYSCDNLNSKYCASGKFYETVLAGIPVLTSTNPPLFNACREYGFGVANDNFTEGLKLIRDNYSFYKKNAEDFAQAFDYDFKLKCVANELKRRLKND